MGINTDGTATCTDCGTLLPGYGVIFGILVSRIGSSGIVENLIFCYKNGCNNKVLTGHLKH